MLSANAQLVYSVNIVDFPQVADMTTQMLATPMTPEQRQVRHAQNFYQLPAEDRALYLCAVAYEWVSWWPANSPLAPNRGTFSIRTRNRWRRRCLAQRLQAVLSLYTAPALPAEYSRLVGAEMFFVKVTLQELSVRVSGAVVNNSSLQ